MSIYTGKRSYRASFPLTHGVAQLRGIIAGASVKSIGVGALTSVVQVANATVKIKGSGTTTFLAIVQSANGTVV
jgi:hypothetical protein